MRLIRRSRLNRNRVGVEGGHRGGVEIEALYTAEATATGAGREGRTRSSDGALDETLTVPAELGGAGGSGTNPEQLFAAGYAACFHNAVKLTARRLRLSATDSSVTARIGIGRRPEGGFALKAELVVRLPELTREEAEAVVEKADSVCPYSNAIRDNVEVKLTVREAPDVI